MSNDRKNFVAYGDAETVVGEIGGKIKNINGQLVGSQWTGETASNIVDFDYTPANGPFENFSIKLEPDVYNNRYDYPWLPGYGKNNFKLTVSDLRSYNSQGTWDTSSAPATYTESGIVYTLVEDDNGNIVKISATGTAVGDSEFRLFDGHPKADGTYNLSGCPTGGSTSSYYIAMMDSATEYINDTGEGAKVSLLAESYTRAWIIIKSSYAIDGTLDFYPMLSTETSTFEPYSNIGSIDYNHEISISTRGKNLCGSWESGAINNLPYKQYKDCKAAATYKTVRLQKLINLNPAKSYTISIVDGETEEYNVIYFDEWKRLKRVDNNWLDTNLVITGESYIAIQVRKKNDANIYSSRVQVEEGTTSTTYKANNGSDITINLDSIIGSDYPIYNGSFGYGNYGLNGNTLYRYGTVVSFNDLTWTYDSTSHEFQAAISNAPYSTDRVRCTCYKFNNDDYSTDSTPHIRWNNSKICIIDDNFNGSTSSFLNAVGTQKIYYYTYGDRNFENITTQIPWLNDSIKTIWTEQKRFNFTYQPAGILADSEKYARNYGDQKLKSYISYSNNIDNGNINKCPLPLNVTTYTSNGITWTVDHMAGTVTANGTCSGGDSEFILTSVDGSAHADDADYTLKFKSNSSLYAKICPTGGSLSTYYGSFKQYSQYSPAQNDIGLGEEINIPSDTIKCMVKLVICEGQTVNNQVWSPMIILKDIYKADSTIFYPYIPSNKELYALVLQQNTILNNLSGIEVVTD